MQVSGVWCRNISAPDTSAMQFAGKAWAAHNLL
jgi:hypothetical protein